jgi:ATP-dependent RNA helicase RhlE
VGRTARAETTGVAITLVNEADMLKMHRIERLIEYEVYKAPLPEQLGPGPVWKLRTTTPVDYFKKKKGGFRKNDPSESKNRHVKTDGLNT